MTLEHLSAALRQFAAERDWEQFQIPKNLALAVAGEVGELLAELQFLTPGVNGTASPRVQPNAVSASATLRDIRHIVAATDVLSRLAPAHRPSRDPFRRCAATRALAREALFWEG